MTTLYHSINTESGAENALYRGKVGIIMRTKNRPLLLKRALTSVLNQTHINWHLCLVNDGGSVEQVNDVIRNYELQFHHRLQVVHNQTSIGMEEASNQGLDKLRHCQFVTVHDDDDTWSPEFLKETVEFLANNKQYIACASQHNIIHETIVDDRIVEDRKLPGFTPPTISFMDMVDKNYIPPICLLVRFSAFKKTGNFNSDLPVVGDWDFHLRLLLEGDIGVVLKPLANYHHRSTTDSNDSNSNSVAAHQFSHLHYTNLLGNALVRRLAKQNPGFLGLMHSLIRKQDMQTQELKLELSYYINSFESLQNTLAPILKSQEIAIDRLAHKVSELSSALKKVTDSGISSHDPAPKTNLNMVWVAYEPTEGYRYRVLYYAEAAEALGINVTHFLAKDYNLYIREIANADVIVLWRMQWDAASEHILNVAKRNKIKVVFDVDDLIFDPSFANQKFMDGIRTQGLNEDWMVNYFSRVQRVMLEADLCTGSTEELVAQFKRHSKESLLLQNGFNEETYRISRIAVSHKPNDGLTRLGYASGTKTHQRDFSFCSSAVARILKENDNCRLVLFRQSDGLQMLDPSEYPEFAEIQHQIEWRARVPLVDLPKELARFDINLAPLEVGNIFVEAKSELKFFEASLVDVPTVASPTGPFKRSIKDGVTGFLANTNEEWYYYLSSLVKDESLRHRVGHEASLDVLDSHGIEYRKKVLKDMISMLGLKI